ncbi:MAG: hypothetical protein R3E31_14365 [Chloroflexota bacterium]
MANWATGAHYQPRAKTQAHPTPGATNANGRFPPAVQNKRHYAHTACRHQPGTAENANLKAARAHMIDMQRQHAAINSIAAKLCKPL